ncbi:hypothetical protein DU258_16430 [Salmonella enterica subsp. enterica]|uniref:hypothetical protein n=1 Tax=Salmonella enterica TaxID=28901 RepID=UPI000F9C0623|nr:hypothetical protein [Salmonella enterica]ECH9428568.1 hypothetical protein [Salmonella enterica subsp. enterica]EAC1131656.1 hypothetical protein [Salmonella enterica subsp. enterica serovar Kambole]EBS2657355.1 hypothetical protein [Salmonella enterica subsp. enterica serovar Kambole]ECG3340225.1 hypothetical protein [Salmonella enterica subsp. enterica serovar Kambole]ECG4917336.1 hypothetical protein [Salmonella enterica subsp. enterica serovar Kambole]
MTTNNHPAHGPVSLDRLHQIHGILSKASAQSDGGNLGYAMADAVKVIDGAIAAFGAEPVISVIYKDGWPEPNSAAPIVGAAKLPDGVHEFYTAPPAPVVPDEKTDNDYVTDCHGLPSQEDCAHQRGWNACRAAMLQSQGGGNQ